MGDEMKHTPTPWGAVDNNDFDAGWCIETVDNSNAHYHETTCLYVAEHVSSKANAAFIVKACNAHDELMNFVAEVAAQETQGNMSGYDFIVIGARRVLAKLQE